MSSRLINDIDANQTKRIFEILLTDSNVFRGYSFSDLEEMLEVLRVVQYRKGEILCKEKEQVDFFGINL